MSTPIEPGTAEPLVLRVRAGTDPGRAMHALTDPDEMSVWLAEHAEVSLPDHYRFWGRYTPGGAAPAQTLVEATSDRLRYTWMLDDVATEVDITLERVADGTLITLRQTGADPMAAGSLGLLQTFWAATLANLVDLLEERQGLALTDLTSPQLGAETTIDAAPSAVFSSLVEAEMVTAWFGFPTVITPEVGGRYGYGTITELVEDQRLSVDYGPMGVASWELEGSGGKTRIVMTQSGFDTDQPPYAAWLGALSGLAELRRFHELASWQPIWVPAGQSS
ncbi:SRPBCC family protein [Pseudactinotalea suaedae]|uniref:SRPBCC family protein n=1 Tax=Pseudactinotalea suaedae TaxID=1524924 RepID=UPI0019D56413|nr:SRPBCC domain-containing protein [Pseudactinotalea suaedae]